MPRLPTVTSKFILLAALAASVGGCGAYLHRPALETATTKIKSDVKALPVPAYLAEQSKRLAEFAAEEDRALAGYLTADRDFSLLNVIEPSAGSASEDTPADKLRSKVDEELRDLAGLKIFRRNVKNDDDYKFITNELSKTLQTARYIAAEREMVAPFWTRQLQSRVQQYRERKGIAATDCKAVLASQGPPEADPAQAKRTYRQLTSVCAAMADTTFVQECAIDPKVGGELRAVCDRIAMPEPTGLEKRAAELRKAIQALEALAKPKDGTAPSENAQKALDDLQKDIEAASELTTNEQYAKVIAALNKAFSIELGKVLEKIGSLPKGKRVGAAKDSLIASLRAIEAAENAFAPNGDPMDEPSALLIGIAKTQHDLNIVNIDIAEEKALVDLARTEANAIRTALHFYARARDILCQRRDICDPRRGHLNQPAVAEALGYYVNGFNQGFIPYRILKFREIQVRRSNAVTRAQAAEADYRALIQPAIDQIAAYGEGGIKPEHLAPLLGSLPIPTF